MIATLRSYVDVFYKKILNTVKILIFLGADDRDLGKQATQLIVDEGYKLANVLPG